MRLDLQIQETAKGIIMATLTNQPVKMMSVDAEAIESIGYVDGSRTMYIKFRGGRTVCINNVPRFRYQGMLAAPRKDAYYTTYVKNCFLMRDVPSSAAV